MADGLLIYLPIEFGKHAYDLECFKSNQIDLFTLQILIIKHLTMASQSSFTSIRFASGLPENLPAAQLKTIRLRKLQDGSMSETRELLDAAISDGFFYLDLTDPGEETFLNHVDEMFALSKAIFDLKEIIKLDFDVDLMSTLKVNG